MKNLLILGLFMFFGSSTVKQDKPVNDSLVKKDIRSDIPIDTSIFMLPETMPSDKVLQQLKETNVIVDKAKLKAIQAMKNAEHNRVNRETDKAFRTLENLPDKTD